MPMSKLQLLPHPLDNATAQSTNLFSGGAIRLLQLILLVPASPPSRPTNYPTSPAVSLPCRVLQKPPAVHAIRLASTAHTRTNNKDRQERTMADDEETFDIYGDDDSSTSPSSPSQQSGPKKRLRRERSSSAPPMLSPKDEDDDGGSTPRQKKIKEDDAPVVVDEDEDPFRDYENHVCCLSVSHSCTTCPFLCVLRSEDDHVFLACMETDVSSIVILKLLLLLLRSRRGLLLSRGRSRPLLLLISLLRLHYMFLNFIGGPVMKTSVAGPTKLEVERISRTSPSPNIK